MDKLESNSEPKHWLFSIPWWGYTCLSFGVVLIFVGLAALLGENAFLNGLGGLSAVVSLFLAFPAIISLLCTWAGKGKQYKRTPIRFHRRVLGFSFLFCIGAIFFGDLLPGARLAVEEAASKTEAENAAQAPWTEHIFSDGNFVVSTPSNWVRVDIPDLGSSGYGLIDEYTQLRVVVSATPKADISVTSVDQLHQMSIANVTQYGSNHVAGELQSFLHRSFPARQTKVTWEDSTLKFLTATRQIEFPEYWVEIGLVASPSKFDKHEERLTRIADSIRRQ